jgi:hypothetical protein
MSEQQPGRRLNGPQLAIHRVPAPRSSSTRDYETEMTQVLSVTSSHRRNRMGSRLVAMQRGFGSVVLVSLRSHPHRSPGAMLIWLA